MILLIYRNNNLDRFYAIYSIILAIISLILYGIKCGLDEYQAGSIIFYALILGWFLSLIHIINQIDSNFTWIIVIIALLSSLFILAIVIYFEPRFYFSNDMIYFTSRAEWTTLLLIIFSLVTLVVPAMILLSHSDWNKVELYFWIVFVIISFSITVNKYGTEIFLSYWFYYLPILILLGWIFGMF